MQLYYRHRKKNSKKYHIIFCNDVSGSMDGKDAQPTKDYIKKIHSNRCGALYEVCDNILGRLDGTPNIISCVLFNDKGNIIFSNSHASASLMDIILKTGANGGTSFFEGMKQVEIVVNGSKPDYEIVCLFMSDGGCSDDGASDIVKRLKSNNRFTLHSVAVSSGSTVLEDLAKCGGGNYRQCIAKFDDILQVYEELLQPIFI